ncbi:Uma2 family endonuclease [Polyangium fumosum]|uniref:Uma2 family endonuclease n=1 Tax=Polyangium fumosum TaxID=889272 RepID=A0A4U1JG61_9BACT|nr:Uma2 family endonuclease [Polyangium fumosum]TKD10255.1 Uma2 family endonuclease [Polyangium fumosum]
MSAPVESYRVEPDDPRAPPEDVWERMSEEERARVVASLPSAFPASEAAPPEGDAHFDAKARTRQTLGSFFQRLGRKVYFACELPVYYPGERMFAPDILAVLDVETHQRMSWVVSAEKKGLDLAIEVYVAGNRRKDLEGNVEKYARLGIREYFIFDRGMLRLTGYRLADKGRVYRRIVPQGGFYASEVLGLELCVQDERLRFFSGTAPLLEADEMIVELRRMMEQVEAHREGEARQREEAERKLAEEERLRIEAEQKLAEALAEIERLRRER